MRLNCNHDISYYDFDNKVCGKCEEAKGCDMTFNVGDTHRAKLSPLGSYKIHILGVFDGNQIVFKYYGRNKQWWHYRIEYKNALEIYIQRAREANHD